jgi:hypothetical protein
MEMSLSVSNLLPTHIYSHLADIAFPPVRGICPSLTLKATVLHAGANKDGTHIDVSDATLCPVSVC